MLPQSPPSNDNTALIIKSQQSNRSYGRGVGSEEVWGAVGVDISPGVQLPHLTHLYPQFQAPGLHRGIAHWLFLYPLKPNWLPPHLPSSSPAPG